MKLFFLGYWVVFSFCITSVSMLVFSENEKEYLVDWTFNDTDITFTITASTTGWVGLGFSPKGGMTGADITIGWVDASGAGHIRDCSASANSLPSIDSQQDVILIEAREEAGKTHLMFTRKLSTGDIDADRIITSDTTRLIWAIGDNDPSDNGISSVDYHGASQRGTKSMYLLDPVSPGAPLPNDVLVFDIVENNVSIPAKDTLYWCSFHKLPELQDKQHIMRMSAIVTEGNEALVHHILVFGCHANDSSVFENSPSHECFTANMPEHAESCIAIIIAWAIGGGDVNFPVEAGFPIGKDPGAPDYVMMEVHYDNPEERAGMVDSSGIKFFHSPDLRTYDIGVLEIGAVDGIFIPPGGPFTTVGICSQTCTQAMLPDEGITVFAFLLHAHLLSRGIKVLWKRGDEVLEDMATDNAYDSNFQETRFFKEPKILLPGDALEARCSLDATDRTEITYGGLSTKEEMCLAILYYYPQHSAVRCQSTPDFLYDPEAVLFSELGITPETRFGFAGVNGSLSKVEWNEDTRSVAQKALYESQFYQQCLKEGGVDYFDDHSVVLWDKRRWSFNPNRKGSKRLKHFSEYAPFQVRKEKFYEEKFYDDYYVLMDPPFYTGDLTSGSAVMAKLESLLILGALASFLLML